MSLAAPVGKFAAARLVTPDLVSLGQVRAPNANLKLGGNTTANSATVLHDTCSVLLCSLVGPCQ